MSHKLMGYFRLFNVPNSAKCKLSKWGGSMLLSCFWEVRACLQEASRYLRGHGNPHSLNAYQEGSMVGAGLLEF